jgi:cbb3-type cytochrome oxidase subunit 1
MEMNTSVRRGNSIRASSVSFVAAVFMVLAGMVWGITMAISQDHSAMPAHAHLNLLGWVSLFLFGIFYHLHPPIDRTRAALAQVIVWIAATIVMVTGVALIHTGHDIGEPIAAVGSIAVLADTLLFGWLVLRRSRFGEAGAVARMTLAPAE